MMSSMIVDRLGVGGWLSSCPSFKNMYLMIDVFFLIKKKRNLNGDHP